MLQTAYLRGLNGYWDTGLILSEGPPLQNSLKSHKIACEFGIEVTDLIPHIQDSKK